MLESEIFMPPMSGAVALAAGCVGGAEAGAASVRWAEAERGLDAERSRGRHQEQGGCDWAHHPQLWHMCHVRWLRWLRAEDERPRLAVKQRPLPLLANDMAETKADGTELPWCAIKRSAAL